MLFIAIRVCAGQDPVSVPAVEGLVLDENTKSPLPGVRVRAFQIDYDLNGISSLSFVPDAELLTDNDGRYVLKNLPPGQYFIRAERNGFKSIFYPNTTDWRTAAPLAYTGVDIVGIDLALGSRDLYRVGGTIANGAADPAKGYIVQWIDLVSVDGFSEESRLEFNQAKDKVGHFEVGDLTSGTYEISAYTRIPDSPGKKGNAGRTRVDVRSEDVKNVEIVLRPGIDLKGRIAVREDSPPLDLSKLQVWLRARYAGFVKRPTNPDSAGVGEDGSFTIRDVHEEEHQFMGILDLPDYAYIQEATVDGIDALHSWVTIHSDSSYLNIIVDGNGGEVSGHVVSGSASLYDDSATVVLVPVRRPGELDGGSSRTVTIEPGSAFQIQGVRPGEYRLLAWHKSKGNAYLNDDFMSAYAAKSTVVKIDRGSHLIANAPVVDAQ